MKLMTQYVFNASNSVNNIQAGVNKGITSHELRIMHNLVTSASTEQMNPLSQNSFEKMKCSCVLREEINI